MHQESDSVATNEHARNDHQLPKILVCEELAIKLSCKPMAEGYTEKYIGLQIWDLPTFTLLAQRRKLALMNDHTPSTHFILG